MTTVKCANGKCCNIVILLSVSTTHRLSNDAIDGCLTNAAKETILYRVLFDDRVWIAEWVTVAALMLASTPWPAMAQAGPNATTTQSSTDRGVTLKVTPKSIGLQQTRWEFSVVLDTHSADISDDLVQSAILTAGDGRTHKPLNWVETVPGGHRREGVLAFDVAAPRPTTIEVRIARPGESTPPDIPLATLIHRRRKPWTA